MQLRFPELTSLLLSALVLSPSHAAEPQPNFIVILGEGSGWTSTSVQMDETKPASRGKVSTPNLERLAAVGLRFAQGYAASPRCTPSRAALLTGRNPAELHMTFVGDGRRVPDPNGMLDQGRPLLTPPPELELPTSTVTIAELLRDAGYATAHFGKWHLGRTSPTQHGFAENDGPNANGGPENVRNPNAKQAPLMSAAGIAFMSKQAEAKQPFYLQLSLYPDQSKERREQDAAESDETLSADRILGEMLDAVERLGLTQTTYVIYTTDHGTPGRNAPLTGGKGTLGEGGLRVPFIVAGPGVPAGACTQVRATALDLLPTLVDLATVDTAMPKQVTGGSLRPVFEDPVSGMVRRSSEDWVVHVPHYDKDDDGPGSALYFEDHKLVRYDTAGDLHLYDVVNDPAERRDLAPREPELVTTLAARLDAYLDAVDAQRTRPNPHPDPDRAKAAGERRRSL